MTEHYCTYEQSVALKRLGFKEKCNAFYLTSDREFEEQNRIIHTNSNHCTTVVIAPKLDQAAAWMREVKGIHIAVDPYCKDNNSDTNICNAEDCFWSMELSSVPFGYWLNVSKGEFDTYESALSAGLYAALELLGKEVNNA